MSNQDDSRDQYRLVKIIAQRAKIETVQLVSISLLLSISYMEGMI